MVSTKNTGAFIVAIEQGKRPVTVDKGDVVEWRTKTTQRFQKNGGKLMLNMHAPSAASGISMPNTTTFKNGRLVHKLKKDGGQEHRNSQ